MENGSEIPSHDPGTLPTMPMETPVKQSARSSERDGTRSASSPHRQLNVVTHGRISFGPRDGIADDGTDSHERTGTDSGYASIASTPSRFSENPEEIAFRQSKIFSRKRISLRVFRGELISQLVWNRFHDLQQLFSKPLFEAISSNKGNVGAISMTLLVMGEDEASKKNCILVECSKLISKKARLFFKQPWVKQELQGGPGGFEPNLEAIVRDSPPRPTSNVTGLPVFSYANDLVSYHEGGACGQRIFMVHGQQTCTATIGGMIKLTMTDTEISLYAMTCGHIVDPPEYGHHSGPPQELSADENGDAEALDVFLDSDDIYEIELEDEYPDNDERASFVGEEAGSRTRAGHIVAHSFEMADDSTSYDWMLVSISKQSGDPYAIISDWHQPRPAPRTANKQATAVVFIQEDGIVTDLVGKISLNKVAYMPPNGFGFVNVYELHFNQHVAYNQRLGISGSWAFDAENTSCVFGHIVASASLGQFFIVPMQDTLDAMNRRFHPAVATLASSTDVEEWNRAHLRKELFDQAHWHSFPSVPPLKERGYDSRQSGTDSGYASKASTVPPSPQNHRHLSEPSNTIAEKRGEDGAIRGIRRRRRPRSVKIAPEQIVIHQPLWAQQTQTDEDLGGENENKTSTHNYLVRERQQEAELVYENFYFLRQWRERERRNKEEERTQQSTWDDE